MGIARICIRHHCILNQPTTLVFRRSIRTGVTNGWSNTRVESRERIYDIETLVNEPMYSNTDFDDLLDLDDDDETIDMTANEFR